MSASNVKRLRNKYARDIEAEIFTINHEIEEAFDKIKAFNYKELKVLNLENLKNLRNEIQSLKHRIDRINSTFHFIEKDKIYSGEEAIVSEDGKQKLIIDSHRLHLAQICDETESRIPDAIIVEDPDKAEIKCIDKISTPDPYEQASENKYWS